MVSALNGCVALYKEERGKYRSFKRLVLGLMDDLRRGAGVDMGDPILLH